MDNWDNDTSKTLFLWQIYLWCFHFQDKKIKMREEFTERKHLLKLGEKKRNFNIQQPINMFRPSLSLPLSWVPAAPRGPFSLIILASLQLQAGEGKPQCCLIKLPKPVHYRQRPVPLLTGRFTGLLLKGTSLNGWSSSQAGERRVLETPFLWPEWWMLLPRNRWI